MAVVIQTTDQDRHEVPGYPTRRDLLKLAAAAAIATGVGVRGHAEQREVRIGFVGVGNRGRYLLEVLLTMPGVRIPAIADINHQNLDKALSLVEAAGHRRPDAYGNCQEHFRSLVLRDDLDAVIAATPWEWHAPIMVATMRAGKFGATEVPAATTLKECWELVDTAEKYDGNCMMLENVCYYRTNMALLNMVRAGLFGELVHAACGYQHDIRDGAYFDEKGALRWRGEEALRRDGSLYTTHGVGPVAQWLDINRGNRFTRLVSMSSQSRGLNTRIRKRFGSSHPNAERKFALGDVNTTLIQAASGATVTVYHDTQLPRPYDLIFRLQGTEGIYLGTIDKIYLEGDVAQFDPAHKAEWRDPRELMAKYDSALWRAVGEVAKDYAHLGGDYMQLHQLVEAIRFRLPAPIDVYDAATWSAVAPLSEASIARGSAAVTFPDFTRGSWKRREATFGHPSATS